jgi:hypothetical protein
MEFQLTHNQDYWRKWEAEQLAQKREWQTAEIPMPWWMAAGWIAYFALIVGICTWWVTQ